jgi:hypothetical protein
MGLYPVAVVLQYTKKKTQNNTHTLKTIHNTQNYKHSTYSTHIKNTKWEFQPNIEPKIEGLALITIWFRPYCTVMNWNNTIIQKTRKATKFANVTNASDSKITFIYRIFLYIISIVTFVHKNYSL